MARVLLVLLLTALACRALFSDRTVHLQNIVLDPLDEDLPPRTLRADSAPAEYIVQLSPPVNAQRSRAVTAATGVKFAVRNIIFSSPIFS